MLCRTGMIAYPNINSYIRQEVLERFHRYWKFTVFSSFVNFSCLTDARNSARISSASSDASEESIGTAFRVDVDMVPLKAGNIKRKTKSVRSECDFDQSYFSSSSKNSTSRKPEMAAKTNIPANSPNPTALKLSDEIQTPGTIFPANMESAGRGRPRIRSQFVHSASNSTDNASLCKLPEDSKESLEQAEVQACKENTENESPTSTICEEKLEETSDEKYPKVETSSSPWVRQGEKKSDKNMEALSITTGDRPIIGMVAAHWNENEQSQISLKWWDGNGIPNSTNKYKEVLSCLFRISKLFYIFFHLL